MNFENINTLEIPQEATELTFNELKLICGGWEEEHAKKEHCQLVKKIVTVKKIFKCKEHEGHEEHEPCKDDN